MNVSLLTIVKGREQALENLILGLSSNETLPEELIVVFMNEPKRELPRAPFKIKQLVLTHESHLPLAAARNYAAKNAVGDLFIFLDVDCIPAPNLFQLYSDQHEAGYLSNGEVRYLNKGATNLDGFMKIANLVSDPDPIRSNLADLPHELFWSLNFSCAASDYWKIGGFDEKFVGYGAEDTDFAFMARSKGIGMKKIPALAYHQHHESYSPPLNHFRDIIENAKMFFSKWGIWPMEGWLKSFEQLDLIFWQDQSLIVKRFPTEIQIFEAKKD